MLCILSIHRSIFVPDKHTDLCLLNVNSSRAALWVKRRISDCYLVFDICGDLCCPFCDVLTSQEKQPKEKCSVHKRTSKNKSRKKEKGGWKRRLCVRACLCVYACLDGLSLDGNGLFQAAVLLAGKAA